VSHRERRPRVVVIDDTAAEVRVFHSCPFPSSCSSDWFFRLLARTFNAAGRAILQKSLLYLGVA